MPDEWKTIKSNEIHRNPWYRLMQDDVLMPSGQLGKYTYIDRLNSVIILALTKAEEIYLVGQYRYPIKKFSWELPQGTMEKNEKDQLISAKRELMEEVGLEAKIWQELGSFYLGGGVLNQKAYLFLAQELTQKQATPDFTEFLTAKKVTLVDFEKQIKAGEIIDSHSIAAFYKLKLFLNKNFK